MPGLIFTSFKNFITSNFDGATWLNIKKSAQLNVDDEEMDIMFDDHMGMLIVHTLANMVNITPSKLLNEIGNFFIQKTIHEKYGNIIFAGGRSLEEFLINLPKFHSKLLPLLQNVDTPELITERINPKKIHLHYYSYRTGMIHFLIGILEGISKIYQTPISIEVQDNQSINNHHDIIEILLLQ